MKQLLFLIIGISMTSLANGQTASPELVSSAGDSYSNATYQLDWSLGECVTETHTAGDYVLTQGFHQSNYEVTAIDDFAKDININVYPNPTTNFITVNFEDLTDFESSQYLTITDLNGKVMQQKNITSNNEELDFSNFADGVYFLTLKQENKIIKIFKIIKN